MAEERNRREEGWQKTRRNLGRAGKVALAGGLSVALTAVPFSEVRGQTKRTGPDDQREVLPIGTIERLADSIHVTFSRYQKNDALLPPDISERIWRAFGEAHGIPDSNSYRIDPKTGSLQFVLPGMTKGGFDPINLEWAREAIKAVAAEALRQAAPYPRLDSVTVKSVTGSSGPNKRRIIARAYGSQPTKESLGHPYRVGRTQRSTLGRH